MHLHDHYSFNFPKGYNIYYGIHFQFLSTVTYFLSSVVLVPQLHCTMEVSTLKIYKIYVFFVFHLMKIPQIFIYATANGYLQ